MSDLPMTYQRLLRRNGLTGARNSGELEAVVCARQAIAADLVALERDTLNDLVIYAAACGLSEVQVRAVLERFFGE